MNNIRTIKVFVVYGNEPIIAHDINEETTAEDVVIYICKKLGISRITRPLFNLRIHDAKEWVSLPVKLIGLNSTNFDLRLRFKVPNLSKLQILDCTGTTYDYCFHQARNDILQEQVPELKNEKHKKALLGLGVTDMFRVMLETNVSKEAVGKDYKKFIPKNIYNCHWFFAKNPMLKSLDSVDTLNSEKKLQPTYVKIQYLTQLEKLAPNYFFEDFNAFAIEGGQEIRAVKIHVNPYDKEFPGIKFAYDGHKEWVHVCSIEDLCDVAVMESGCSMVISRKTGIPCFLKFASVATMFSLASLLDGYYRLGVKWTFSLSRDLQAPALEQLRSLKCHGPVGGDFSFRKLARVRNNKPGSFILRESELTYDEYCIDVCNENRNPITYKIERRDDGMFYFNDKPKQYESLQNLLHYLRSPESPVKLLECLPPSEYDVSPLLLCRTEQTNVNDDEDGSPQGAPSVAHFIHSNELLLYKGRNKMHIGNRSDVYQGAWQRKQRRQVNIALKVFKSDCTVEEQLELMSQWASVQSPVLVKLYGLTLHSPLGLVMELLPLGPLNTYLQHSSRPIKEVDLVEAATYLASALWNLQEAGMIHGNVRCRKLLVAAHTESSFVVRLADPGPPKPYTDSDVHWLPPECYHLKNNSCKTTTSDIWAFGTTLWEIFSKGVQPTVPDENVEQYYRSGKRLPQPEDCSNEIFLIMIQCWTADFQRRKTMQEALRDINRLFYQVYNQRRMPHYEDPNIENYNGNSSVCVGLSNNTTLTTDMSDESSAPPMLNGRLEDLSNSWLEEYSKQTGVELEMNELDLPLMELPVFSQMTGSTDDGSTSGVLGLQCMLELDNRWKLVLVCKIGQGNYGEVYKASLEQRDSNEEPQTVAVKRLKNKLSNELALQEFYREIDIMKGLQHENIVQIKAVIYEPEVNLVMDFFQHGSLLFYVQVHRERLSHKTKTKLLLKFALDIANGMAYLGSKGIVHRDLAARNILVASESQVKISDFGLARVVAPNSDPNSGYYVLQNTLREIPIKWYAPEALRNNMWSSRTDMWSYGVTLFEMFSFGEDPQLPTMKELGSNIDQELLIAELESGVRLPPPENCSTEIYSSLMYPCWAPEPKRRPTFSQAARTIQRLIDNSI